MKKIKIQTGDYVLMDDDIYTNFSNIQVVQASYTLQASLVMGLKLPEVSHQSKWMKLKKRFWKNSIAKMSFEKYLTGKNKQVE